MRQRYKAAPRAGKKCSAARRQLVSVKSLIREAEMGPSMMVVQSLGKALTTALLQLALDPWVPLEEVEQKKEPESKI